jgi:hypothetical protein
VLPTNNITEDLSNKIADSVVDDLTANLRHKAEIAGWPSDYAYALSVENQNGTIVVTYPSEKANAIEDLEYGAEQGQPSGVIRSFINQEAEELAKDTKYGIMNFVKETGAGGIW